MSYASVDGNGGTGDVLRERVRQIEADLAAFRGRLVEEGLRLVRKAKARPDELEAETSQCLGSRE